MDTKITHIINKALDGNLLDRDEIIALLSVENLSAEAFAIQQAGRAFTSELCDGEAEIHAHVGLDAGACPSDCKFCAFAASNRLFKGHQEHPIETVVKESLELEAAGANAIYLVTTTRYSQEKFLEVGKQVMAALKPETPLIANIPDFDEDYAKELVKVGFKGCYHVVRLGEGEFTRCKVEDRLRTMRAAKDAGLVLGHCIDPIGPEHTPEQIADSILLAREFEVAFSGAMRRNTVAGTPFEKFGNIPYGRLAVYAGACALATGTGIKGNCTHEPSTLCAQAGANVMWASRGTDPRDTNMETARGLSVNQVREMYFETDWKVHEGPSRVYR